MSRLIYFEIITFDNGPCSFIVSNLMGNPIVLKGVKLSVSGLLYKEVDLSTSLEMDNITTSVYNTSTITFYLNNPNATYT